MRILINTSTLRFGGAVQGALSFINECKFFPEHEYHVIVGRGVHKSLKRKYFPNNFHFYNFDNGPVSIWKIPHISRILSNFEKQILPDCVVTTSGPSYWHSNAPQLMGFNLGLYIYPESPFMELMSFYRKSRWFFKRKLHFYFFKRDAAAYFVQTEDVNRRISNEFHTNKVFTVSNTHNSFFLNPPENTKKLGLRKNGEIRILTITAYYRHKNLEIIPGLIKELVKRGYKNVRFVLTIDQGNYDRIFQKEHLNEVVTIGSVKPEECPSLYQECDFMFLPTLAECFSASYPEAMVMKKPIITTDLDFAHDICGDAALYFEPMNHIAAADVIEKLINDEQLQLTLKENGQKRLTHFNTAQERARQILKICKDLVNN
jgi:glycosyltransferase involved in cell wall biosynthesis